MERKRNLLPLGGFLVCAVGFLSYFLVFSRFPATRDLPWTSWLLFALGLGMAGAGATRAFRRPETYRGRVMGPLFGGLSLAVVGFFLFATLMLSRELPTSAGAPKVGEKAPDFVLLNQEGRPVRLYDFLGSAAGSGRASWVVLIFYRGYW